MQYRYSDERSIIESLRKCVNEQQEGRLEIVESQARMVALTREERDERNLDGFGEHVCTIEYEAHDHFNSRPTSGVTLTLHIHESKIDSDVTFELTPAGTKAIAPTQATQPTVLGEQLERVLTPLEETLDIQQWDFVSVDAASIAHGGYLTDYEFQYEAIVNIPNK